MITACFPAFVISVNFNAETASLKVLIIIMFRIVSYLDWFIPHYLVSSVFLIKGTVRQRKFSSRQALSVAGIHETAFASQPGIDGYEIEEIALEDTDRLRDAAVPIHAKRSFK